MRYCYPVKRRPMRVHIALVVGYITQGVGS